jgi:rhodanese-related sulfurtransferase
MGHPARSCRPSLAGLTLAFLVLSAVQGRADLPGPPGSASSLSAALLFPSVQTISLRELWNLFHEVRVVDVRTRFEFDVVHIRDSLHRPLSGDQTRDAGDGLADLARGTTLVFTGNDPHDTRPFTAALEALGQGIPVRVNRQGVLAWTDAFPSRSVLMGSCPADPEAVLPNAVHRRRLIGPGEFPGATGLPNTLCIDIRSAYDRAPLPGRIPVRTIPMEAFLEAVGCRVWSEKTLILLDRDSSRLPWLHRFLQAAGYDDLLFLEGGTQALGAAMPEPGPGERKLPDDDKAEASVSVNQDRLAGLLSDAVLTEAQKRLMLLVLAGLVHENYAVMPIRGTAEAMACPATDLMAMADVLQTSGYVRYAASAEALVFRVDPGLAWKGPGRDRENQARLFLDTAEPWRER